MTVFKNWNSRSRQNAKENFSDKLGRNILRLFDVLPNFPFTTSETNGDY